MEERPNQSGFRFEYTKGGGLRSVRLLRSCLNAARREPVERACNTLAYNSLALTVKPICNPLELFCKSIAQGETSILIK